MPEVTNEDLRPRMVGGLRVGPAPRLDGTIPRTRRQAMGASFGFMWDNFVVDRWRMLGEEDSPQLTEAEFKELDADRGTRFYPGITRRQVEQQIAEHDFAEFEAQFQQFPGSQMLAGFGALFLDPVTVGTLPFGAKNAVRAGAASTLRQFVLQSTIASFKIAGVVTPAEAAAQLRQTGRLQPEVLAAQVALPFVAVPALAGLGRAFRRFRPGQTADPEFADALGKRSGGAMTPIQVGRLADDVAHLRPPRVHILQGDRLQPKARLRQAFEGYEGGHRAWLRDLSAGRESARVFARERLGIDPDAPSLRDAVIAMQDRSAQTHVATLERILRVNDAMNRFRAGDRDADLVRVLTEEGLVVPRARVVDGELRPTGEVGLSATGRVLDDALQDPTIPANRAVLDAVNRDGPGALDRIATRRGVDTDPDTNPQASANRIAADELDEAELIKALEVAGLETRPLDGPSPFRAPPEQPHSSAPRTARERGTTFDADIEGMSAELRRIGVDPEEITTAVRQFREAVNTCLKR